MQEYPDGLLIFLRRTRKFVFRHLRSIVSQLPKSIKYKIYRKAVTYPPILPKEFVFKVAETRDELEQSMGLLYDCYVNVGLMEKNEIKMRVTPYHMLPSTVTLIVKRENEVVGTLSLIRQSEFGIPAEKAFCLDEVLKSGKRTAEVSALAIKKEWRGILLFPLMKYMYEFAIGYFGVKKLISVIVTTRGHHEFYESLLGFRPIHSEVVSGYQFANNLEVLVEELDLDKAYNWFENSYNQKKSRGNLFVYFTQNKIENFQFPKRNLCFINDPFLDLEMLNYFFKEKNDIYKDLSEKELLALSYIYDLVDLDLKNEIRKNKRFDVDIQASEKNNDGFIIWNISRDGSLVINLNGKYLGDKFKLNFNVKKFECSIELKILKNDENKFLYCQIINSNEDFKNYIKTLECDFSMTHEKEVA